MIHLRLTPEIKDIPGILARYEAKQLNADEYALSGFLEEQVERLTVTVSLRKAGERLFAA